MTRRLFLSWLPGETRAAVMHDDRLTDLLILRADRPSLFGNVYLGRITSVHKGLDAAFIDIGINVPGLLARADSAGEALIEGDSVLVRVKRDPFDGKGPRLAVIAPEAGGPLEALREAAQPPSLLSCDQDPLRILACKEPAVDEILVDQAEAVARLKVETFDERPDLAAKVEWASQGAGLFREEGLEDEIDALLEPFVALPSGGSLLIEPVRSMTPIDVNSGRYARSQKALVTNREAADEIPRQLRLRSLSGLVIIDFLETKDPRHRQSVVQSLRDGLKADSVAGRVSDMRKSGLVELTRKRVQPALREILTDPCGLGGSGRIKSAETLAYEALRSVQQEARRNPGAAVSLRARSAVSDALQGVVKPASAFVEGRLGRALSIVPIETSRSFDYEVVVESRT